MPISTNRWHDLLDDLRPLAQRLMAGAGEITAEHKADGSWVTAVDHAVQDAVRSLLAERFPESGFLGEEMTESEQADAWQACIDGDQALWVVDPLDGTSNFRAGFPVYSLTLALLVEGRVAFGAIYDPVRDELFHAQRGEGAWLNDVRLDLGTQPALPLNKCLAAVDFKRLSADLACKLAAQPPYASQRSIGSVALDWCWLAAGRIQVYVHGKQKLWDYAAAQLVLHEAGGVSAQLDERIDQPEARLDLAPRSAVAATNADLLEAWQQAMRLD
jgi:myo-inositol-1(or 4)-monophosphatase